MSPWILAARPKTLPAAVVPVWVGCVLAWHVSGVFHGVLAICTLLSAMCIQVATNFLNDVIDFKKGADGEKRLGPTRVTASGMLSLRRVAIAAVVMMLLAAAFAVPLIRERGWPILAIGIPSLYFSYGYTGGPLPLAYRGLGELFVILFFGFIAVAGTVFVQTGEWLPSAVVAGFQVGCLSTVLIAVNNLRDVEEDGASGKRTLAVRFGKAFGRCEITALCVLPQIAGLYWLSRAEAPLFWWPLGALAVGAAVSRGVWKTEPGPEYNRYLAWSGLQLILFAVLFSVGALR